MTKRIENRMHVSRAALVGALSLHIACTRSHVAAFAGGTQGSSSAQGSGGTTGAAEDTAATSTAVGTQTTDASATDASTTGATACVVPPRLPDCDQAADPLRALEVTCYDDVSAAEFRSEDEDAWRRAREFGNAFWVSEDSEAVLVLTTGRLALPDAAGQVEAVVGGAELEAVDNDNPNAASLPTPMVVAPGSVTPYVDCDGIGDCSHTLADAVPSADSVSDLVWLRFRARVPDGVRGYSVQVGFLTAEYPERVGEAGNTTFIWWSDTESFTGNLATWGDAVASATGLADRLAGFTDGHPILTRTGFDGISADPCSEGGGPSKDCPVGATTGWMTLRGPATPGETIEIAAALFEQDADVSPETVVVLDDWQWSCNGCTPGESCGFQ